MQEIKYRSELKLLLPDSPVTCEVGVAEGNFSRDILAEWNPSLHYMVDNWGTIENYTGDGNFPQEWHNMNYHTAIWRVYPYSYKVKILRGLSWQMAQHVADAALDIVYLDAGHSFEAVKKDLEAWFPKVKPGGIIAGHDFRNQAYGVAQAVREFCKSEGVEVHEIPSDKDEDAGFWFRKKLKKK